MEYIYQPRKPCPKIDPATRVTSKSAFACVRCHGNTGAIYQALGKLETPYDKLDPDEKKWRSKIYSHVISSSDMPPQHESELIGFRG